MELKFDLENPKLEYIKAEKRAIEALKKLAKETVVGVDIEATGFDPFTETILTVQIGTAEISYIFDARKIDLGNISEFKKILSNPKIVKLLHNGKFDYKWIRHHTGVRIKNIYDTMLAEAVLNCGLGSGFYSLAELAKRYADVDLDKDIRASFEGMAHARFSDEQLKYGAKDTLILFPIFEKQVKQLKKKDVFKIAKLEFAVTIVVGEMEYRGIYVNVKKWKELLKDIAIRREEAAEKFYEAIRPLFSTSQMDLFGKPAPPINLNSQVQLMNLFNNKLGLGIPSTGVNILKEQEHPIARLLMDYRQYEKLLSAFGESFLKLVNKKTGRVHPSFNQLGTATGRFSCNNPNLQQVPAGRTAPFRECFNPKKGYKMVVSDYSSMEMRILADLSGDKVFIEAIDKGLDLHSYTASLMFGVEYTENFKSEHPDLRYAAKAINFGLMYGMGPMSLARQINVSTEEGEEYMEKYFRSYPSVRDWLDKQSKDAVRNGWSSTPFGRKRWYRMPEKTDPEFRRKISRIQRQAKNHPIQGTNADAIKYALVYVQERFDLGEFDGGITHTIHDEIVCEVKEDQAEKFAEVLSQDMIRAAELFVKRVPIDSVPFIGDVWEH
ncbi:DNA polymerase [Patescibacteria group bacterium]